MRHNRKEAVQNADLIILAGGEKKAQYYRTHKI